MSEKKPSVLEGFKAFLMRGNVVDLAVAVVIGAAFTNIVNSVVKGIINPLVGTIAVVYFLMVLPMSKYLARMEARRKAKEGTHEIIEVTELEVLKEIRDALVAQRGSGHDGR
ncbi:MAG: MscL family protein [Streptomyces sp.]|uniref:large conductance mechanosensitive channel protein MscL n=1 Tax=Streptomyces sp. TaxID=1931 RepID=UPI0025EF315A|nr:MscL family protein [Streptomyces sp.]MBW8802043.1 MscL family protein [Streptomyces sp.]